MSSRDGGRGGCGGGYLQQRNPLKHGAWWEAHSEAEFTEAKSEVMQVVIFMCKTGQSRGLSTEVVCRISCLLTIYKEKRARPGAVGKETGEVSMVRRENSVAEERGRFGGKPLEMEGRFFGVFFPDTYDNCLFHLCKKCSLSQPTFPGQWVTWEVKSWAWPWLKGDEVRWLWITFDWPWVLFLFFLWIEAPNHALDWGCTIWNLTPRIGQNNGNSFQCCTLLQSASLLLVPSALSEWALIYCFKNHLHIKKLASYISVHNDYAKNTTDNINEINDHSS